MTTDTPITQYALGRRHRADDPKQWKYQLVPPVAVDRTRRRSLARFLPGFIFDQGAEASCTANSSVLIQMACAAIAGLTNIVTLSREELYFDERQDEATLPADAGAYTADSFDSVLRRGGLVAESVWPYDANPAETPPAAVATAPRALYIAGHQPIAMADAIDGAISALDSLKPLAVAFEFCEEFYAQLARAGVLSAAPTSPIVGGHQVTGFVYVPPDPAKPETVPDGLLAGPNSWGLTSPARRDLDPDWGAGWIGIPLRLAALGVLNELRAAVPVAAPPSCRERALAIVDGALVATHAALAAATVQSAKDWYSAGLSFEQWVRALLDTGMTA